MLWMQWMVLLWMAVSFEYRWRGMAVLQVAVVVDAMEDVVVIEDMEVVEEDDHTLAQDPAHEIVDAVVVAEAEVETEGHVVAQPAEVAVVIVVLLEMDHQAAAVEAGTEIRVTKNPHLLKQDLHNVDSEFFMDNLQHYDLKGC